MIGSSRKGSVPKWDKAETAPERTHSYLRMLQDTQSLRARHYEKQLRWQEMMVPEITRRLGATPDQPEDSQAKCSGRGRPRLPRRSSRFGRDVPGGQELPTAQGTGYDYMRTGKPDIAGDDQDAKDGLVSALVTDASNFRGAVREGHPN